MQVLRTIAFAAPTDKYICIRVNRLCGSSVFGEDFYKIAAAHGLVTFDKIFFICYVKDIWKLVCFFKLHEQLRKPQGLRRACASVYTKKLFEEKLGNYICQQMFDEVDKIYQYCHKDDPGMIFLVYVFAVIH